MKLSRASNLVQSPIVLELAFIVAVVSNIIFSANPVRHSEELCSNPICNADLQLRLEVVRSLKIFIGFQIPLEDL